MTRDGRTAAEPSPDENLPHWRTWRWALAWAVVAIGLAAFAWAVRGVGWNDGTALGTLAALALP